ncbi:winged helix-turn-helix domain-containing protein [Vibrio mediterranei]|uniref:winged helix-turn-helix domain-containing protein n=1 Tax=Vibrio mediterranei TaxID=689 RepID=UPI00228367B7|nr:winged helix-turn-helix domain-containing protein [Vibrio mediterranei]MCY9854347.1 winged helix-turn-helix domain-containing protein [Vibrio mediterranei]
MKNQKIQFKIDEWVFYPYEDKFVLDGEDIVIDNRLSKLFHFLCENPDTVFSRDELINEVWNGSILTDQVITQAIFELRKILKQHGNHPYGYIVTVPKRGYKLDATVEKVIEATQPVIETTDASLVREKDSFISESTSVESTNTEVPEAEATVEAEISTVSQEKPQIAAPVARSKKTGVKKRWIATAALIIVGLAVGSSYLHVKQSDKQVVEEIEPIAIPSYLSLEPRYIHVVLEPGIVSDDLKVGFIKKLLELLKTYKDFRIIYDGPAAKVAANELKFASSQRDNQDYIEIEYVNRISGHKHLDRKYRVTEDMLRPSMKKSLDDLLDSFSIEIEKTLISDLVDELPDDSVSVQLALTSIGASYHDYTHSKALEMIDEAKKLSPNNPYIVASNYIFNISNMYLHPPQDMVQYLDELNLEASTKFEEFESSNQTTPRVLEATAMMALTNDKPLQAKSILQAIPHERRTVFFYILNAKASELIGNRDAAEEFYYHAVLESSTIQVLNLSEVLFFNSDLSDIKKKVETSLNEKDAV